MFGFGSFLAYLGYGYLDTWHGVGTMLLLPVFAIGLYRSWTLVSGQGGLLERASIPKGTDRLSLGRLTIIIGGIGVVFAGLSILWIGLSDVFVSEDTHFIGSSRAEVAAISPRLIPLIAHDRAGFGGAVVVMGLITVMAVVFGKPTRSMFEAIALAGIISLGSAILIHLVVGYTDLWHLTPPILGALSLIVGIALAYPLVRSYESDAKSMQA